MTWLTPDRGLCRVSLSLAQDKAAFNPAPRDGEVLILGDELRSMVDAKVIVYRNAGGGRIVRMIHSESFFGKAVVVESQTAVSGSEKRTSRGSYKVNDLGMYCQILNQGSEYCFYAFKKDSGYVMTWSDGKPGERVEFTVELK